MKEIQTYARRLDAFYQPHGEPLPVAQGDWVKYRDHLAALDEITKTVLAYKPKPKSKAAKRRSRKEKKEKSK